MTNEKVAIRSFPYPTDPEDGTVVFHRDMVCQYYSASNTWACSRVLKPTEE